STATRLARYGTVTSPTRVASTKEVEARMSVAQRFPASRETVEKSAAPNASPNPTRDSKNFTHTSAVADCSQCIMRLGAEEAVFDGLAYVEPIHFEPSIQN